MINVKQIIQQGENAKYQVIIEHEDFTMTANDFRLTLTWGMRGESLTITKADMLENDNGQYYFTFDTTKMVGWVQVECEYDVPDDDFDSGYRTENERQPLCFVNTSSKLPSGCDCGLYDGTHVTYVRQTRGGLKTLYVILRDFSGNILRDLNGNILRALKRDN